MSNRHSHLEATAYRERIIQHILSTEAGIYGGEVCQLCGTVKTFRHLWGAQFTHRGPDFVCSDCIRTFVRDPDQIGLNSDDTSRAFKKLSRLSTRRCEICTRRIASADRNRHVHGAWGGSWVCDPCSSRVLSDHGGEWPDEMLLELRHRRYLALKCPTDNDLRGFSRMVAEMRFEMDEGWAGPPKSGLEGTREERWREMVRAVGEVHGIDYLSDTPEG